MGTFMNRISEKRVLKSLRRWFVNHIASDTASYIYDETTTSVVGTVADFVFVQSRSDTIHAVEIKNKITESSLNSALWQLESYKANYKWLVLPADEYYERSGVFTEVAEHGFGLLLFSGRRRISFEKKLNPIYLYGNFIEFWPAIYDDWYG